MPRSKTVLAPAAASDAVRIRARRDLAALEERRFAWKQLAQGASQQSIADALGTSQAQISRWAKEIESNPRLVAPSVSEAINRKVIGELTPKQFYGALAELKVSYVNPVKRPDSAWAALRAAYRAGALSDAEARTVARRTAERMVGRVHRHMALEAQPVSDHASKQAVQDATKRLLDSL